ncbi:unnamed protein product [Gadus morhua 'NCC']
MEENARNDDSPALTTSVVLPGDVAEPRSEQRHPVPALVTPCRTDAMGTLSPVHGPRLPWPSVSFLQVQPPVCQKV